MRARLHILPSCPAADQPGSFTRLCVSIAQNCERFFDAGRTGCKSFSFLSRYRDETKISSPMKIKMAPPKMEALPARRVPKVRPITSPAVQITKVTAAITAAQATAIQGPYSAMVKPTDSASMEVATPCSSRPPLLTASASSSYLWRTPSHSILPPM